MPRFKLTLEYDGAPFVGWQRQTNGLAVQEVIERAIHAVTGETMTIRGAGRTDAGVHATAQVAHADLARDWRPDVLRDALNAHMRPHPVVVTGAEPVAESFDARFSAVRRHYVYRLRNRRAPLTLTRGREWLIKRKLDADVMREGARLLLGKHDFSTFRDSECQAESPIRTLDQLDVERDGETILIRAAARSFLHRQSAPWSDRSNMSAPAAGRPRTSATRSTRETADGAAWSRPPTAFISSASITRETLGHGETQGQEPWRNAPRLPNSSP
jgi:tRNA pseudouridine38-40 synthase